MIAAFGSAGSAIAAIIGISMTVRTNRKRAQPVLIAELAITPHDDQSQQLVIRNVGPTTARNVQVSFDPSLPSDSKLDFAESVRLRYEDPIPCLAPGQSLTNVWWGPDENVPEEVRHKSNEHGLPTRFKVKIVYNGISRLFRIKSEFVLDTATLNFTSSVISTRSLLGTVQKVPEKLDSIAKAINSTGDCPYCRLSSASVTTTK